MKSWADGMQRFRKFVSEDIWAIDPEMVSMRRSVLIRLLRVAQLVFKGFEEDELPVHASALTFATLMSLVPMLAVAFALLRGFGIGQERLDQFMKWSQSMPAEFQEFVRTIMDVVQSTNFAAMGWVGLAAVVSMAIAVLGRMEATFDKIWGVQRPRNALRKVTNYISVLVVVPVLIGVASTIETGLHGVVPLLPQGVGSVLRTLLRLTSLFTTWVAFWALYTFLPNTKVAFLPASVSSFAAALTWILWQKAYITLQVGVARYNAVYGTFASVPIFLAWLYTSWVIILLGAELAFALQNAATYSMETSAANASPKARLQLAFALLVRAAEAFQGRKQPLQASAFSRQHHIPVRLVNDLLRTLVRAGYLVEAAGPEPYYVLGRAPEQISLREIFDLIMAEGSQPERAGAESESQVVRLTMAEIEQRLGETLAGRTLLDLLRRAQETAAKP